MAAQNIDNFLTDVLVQLLDAAASYASPSIPSDTLRRSLTPSLEYVNQGQAYGRLYIDPYWAIYLHDGRNRISKAPLIWFRNPNDDPRLAPNGVISRYSEWSSLTPQEFKYWARRNREAERNGLPPPMIVRWYGVAGVTGSFFFDNNVGMRGFLAIAHGIVYNAFLEWMQDELGDLLVAHFDSANGVI